MDGSSDAPPGGSSSGFVQISPFNGDPNGTAPLEEPEFHLRFEDALELERVQSKTCQLLSAPGLAHGIAKYCPQLLERLWRVLCAQLEHCDFALKSDTLTLCASLILDHGFPVSTSVSLKG